MDSIHFFFGSGKLRIWYILFYLLTLPLSLLGIFLFSQLQSAQGSVDGEFVLSILATGYLVLGFFSMINTILYVQKTHKYLLGSSLFLGFQILFWVIGYGLGNTYILLLLFFIVSFLLAIYLNLQALSCIHKTIHPENSSQH